MVEWGENGVCKLELGKEAYGKLLDGVKETARRRKESQGKLNDADFAAGAMTVMEKLGIPCPIWPLMIMSGRDWLEGLQKKD